MKSTTTSLPLIRGSFSGPPQLSLSPQEPMSNPLKINSICEFAVPWLWSVQFDMWKKKIHYLLLYGLSKYSHSSTATKNEGLASRVLLLNSQTDSFSLKFKLWHCLSALQLSKHFIKSIPASLLKAWPISLFPLTECICKHWLAAVVAKDTTRIIWIEY